MRTAPRVFDMDDGRDWTQTARGECADCGYDASRIDVDGFDEALQFEAGAWAHWLDNADDAAARRRRADGTWSALEYACHVRDLLAVFSERVDLMREGDADAMTWWDHEAAAVEQRYNEQDRAEVADAIANNAMILSAATIGVEGDMWDFTVERRPGEPFKLVEAVRFALHESFHHRMDANDSLNQA